MAKAKNPYWMIDNYLLVLVLSLTFTGILFSYSSDLQINQEVSFNTRYLRQIFFLISGLMLMWFVSSIYYKKLASYYYIYYAIIILILLYTLLISGQATKLSDAKRWISLGIIRVQPSEFLKIIMIISTAKIFTLFYDNLNQWRKIALVSAFIFFPIGLVLLQPDLGTSIVFIPIYLGMFFFTQINKKTILLIIVALLLLPIVSLVNSYLHLHDLEKVISQFIPLKWLWVLTFILILLFTLLIGIVNLFWKNLFLRDLTLFLAVACGSIFLSFILDSFILKDYQKARIFSFINPYSNVTKFHSGYHIIQSQITIGSGGILGKGLFNGSQVQLGFLPARGTDFIFAVIGEELGFLGVFVIILLFYLLFLRLIYMLYRIEDILGRLIVMGIIMMFFFQFIVNISMTIGLAPITGLPLVFITYGGSTLWTSYIAIGLVSNIYHNRYLSTEKKDINNIVKDFVSIIRKK